jgi:hypothetical protein
MALRKSDLPRAFESVPLGPDTSHYDSEHSTSRT